MKHGSAASDWIEIIPNPVNNKATVSFNALKTGKYSLQIRDVAGRAMITQSGNAVAGENKITFDASRLQAGMYFIHLQLENESRMLHIPFQKQ